MQLDQIETVDQAIAYLTTPGTNLKAQLQAAREAREARETAESAAPSAAPPAVARYKMMSLDDVIAQPPPTWIIDGLLATKAVTILQGQWGIGKSFITLDWALSVATGSPWIEHGATTGPVIYIAAEGAGGMGKRVQAWAAKTGRALPGADRFIMIPEPVNLMDDTTPSAFVAALAVCGIENPALIVFDTLSRCTLGGEENSNSEMALAIARATQIAQETGAGILLVHHPGKSGDIRGASAIPGNVETVIRVASEEGVLKVECEKMKDAAPFDPFYLMLQYVESADSMVVVPASGAAMAGTREGVLTPNMRKVMDALCSPSIAGCARHGELKEASGITHPETFRRATDAVLNRGLARVEGPPGSRERRYYPTEAGRALINATSPISHSESQITHSESHTHMSHTPLKGCDSVTVTAGVTDTVIAGDTLSAQQGRTSAQQKAPAQPQTRVAETHCTNCHDQADLSTRPGKSGYWRPCWDDAGKCSRAARAGAMEGGAP